jgi:hypothetical protein
MAIVLESKLGITTPDDTVTGNTIQGDATTDTLTVGVTGIVKDASGNVGIGTASPTQKLQVNGGIMIVGAATLPAAVAALLSFESPVSRYYIGDGTGYSWAFSKRTSSTTTDLMTVTDTGLFQFNSGYGSAATAYGCRAWVNFNGTGTVAIRASGNVSSITDNNTGDYTVNFTTAMPDANYCAVVPTSPGIGDSLAQGAWFGGVKTITGAPQTKTVSALRIAMATYNGPGGLFDTNETNVSVFR